ncbi:Elf1-domain-containing protein [Polyplosphaeria fusca]|uniref:Transcription elongation factor 1 homolog n=1 Tax=Polyplosphaeria fusca TaxID=682080 RepID=A0A9P4UYB6_9PLEO|nr:Elf1-domain-containing protein [Polyplosphaeria fusca]
MGKRKSSKKVQGPKKKEKLPTTFQCLFCNHEGSITCSLDKKSGVGSLQCKVCGQTFQTTINYLSAPVDVYADWIDACDEVAKQSTRGAATEKSANRIGSLPKSAAVGGDEGGLGDDFIVDDEQDADGEFADDD